MNNLSLYEKEKKTFSIKKTINNIMIFLTGKSSLETLVTAGLLIKANIT